MAAAAQRADGAAPGSVNRNGEVITELAQEVNGFLRQMRDQTAEIARRGVAAARERQRREEAAAKPTFSPSPF
jgi:predicted phage tail protein